MGIELKLTVTPEDIKGLYTGENRELHLSRVEAGRNGPQPNLFRDSLTLIVTPFGEPGLFNNVLIRELSNEDYITFQGTLASCVDTYHQLFYDFLVENRGEKEPDRLEQLARQHHRELAIFARAYNSLCDKTVDPRSIIEENRCGVDPALLAKKGDGGKRMIEDYWKLGIKGLAEVVLIANRLYSPGTMKEFLAHVDKGVIDHDYLTNLSHNYLPQHTPPQTL